MKPILKGNGLLWI